MDLQDDGSRLHEDPRIRRLLSDCPFLAERLDLSEGPYGVAGEVALLLRDGALSNAEANFVFAHLHRMAEGDVESQNLLVVGILEVLGDTPQSIARVRRGLGAGPARPLFERVLKGWITRRPN